MKKFNQALATTFIFSSLYLNAAEFRIGPKVGLGLGTITGVKGDAEVALAPIVGLLTQFDFETFAIDAGMNYRYNVFVSAEKIDNDADSIKDTNTSAIGYSSVEIPVTAYYKLNVGKGFFKFGGGAGLDLGFGKVKLKYEEENSTSSDVDLSDTVSFSDAGLKQVDLYLIAALGYEFVFDSFALSIDFQPKYGLLDKAKSNSNVDYGKWHTLWFDLGVGFLF